MSKPGDEDLEYWINMFKDRANQKDLQRERRNLRNYKGRRGRGGRGGRGSGGGSGAAGNTDEPQVGSRVFGNKL